MSTPAPPLDRGARTYQVRRVLLIVLVLNLAVAVAKGIAGYALGSLAIASDAVHSLIDGGGNVLGLVVLRYASQPADEGHPYGHQKIEVLASAAVGAVVSLTALRFAWEAVEGLIVGRPVPIASPIGFAVGLGTFVVNLFVAAYEARRARALGSSFLAADAAHTASDILVTGAVMLSYAGAYLGYAWADPLGALLVVGFIAKVAWTILQPNVKVLTDSTMVDPEAIARVVGKVPGVLGCHRVRSRGAPDAVTVDLHVHVDGDLSLREAHDIASAVERAIDGGFPEVIDVNVHVEPAGYIDYETPLPG
jgi:cation diffusion facilitator family transporter